jgi:[ribosomal protein S5]-alanine N-acetyltransferase
MRVRNNERRRTMLVKGSTVYLRTIRETDIPQLAEYLSDIEMRGPYFPIFIDSEATLKKMYAEDGFLSEQHGDLLICDIKDNTLLGILYYFKSVPYYDGFEIGYRLFDTGNSGRGIMTEALMLCTYLLFIWLPIHRLELKIMPDNSGSKRVAEKCGYQFEGVARQAAFHHGAHHDFAIFSILRHEAPKTLKEAHERLAALKQSK